MTRTDDPSTSIMATTPDRLRWIAQFLDLADRAITVFSCVQGLDYPTHLHRSAQDDLRSWARWLDDHPVAAAELDAVRSNVGVVPT
jgi:hypothetical protein